MKSLRRAVAIWALGALAGCNGLIGLKDIYLDDAGAPGERDATAEGDGGPLGMDGGAPRDSAMADRTVADAGTDTAPTCTNTVTDDKNCGVCGHDCLGGACAGSKCQPAKVITGQGQPWAIRVDGSSIYWSDIFGSKGTIYKIAKLAVLGAPIKLAETADPLVYDLVIDGTDVYFSSGSSGNGGFVERVPLSGGTKEVVSPGADPRGLSIDATRVYWSNGNAPTDVLAAAKVADAGSVTLAPAETSPAATFADGTRLFWMTSGTLRRCTLPACADRADMVTGLSGAEGLATNSTLLFYSTDNGVFLIAKGAAPGPGATVAAMQALPLALAADEKDVVWANLGFACNSGDIRRCPITGGAAQCNATGEVLFTTSNCPRGIALDAKAIYWTVQSEGAVYRLAR